MVATRRLGAAATALLHLLAGGDRTEAQARSELGLNSRQLGEAAARLRIRGYLVVKVDAFGLSEAGASAALAGEVIRGGPKGRVKIIKDTFRARAWRAMRLRRTFTIGEIVADAARAGEAGQPRDNAARYIRRLVEAGYLVELPQRKEGTAPSSNGFKQFRLALDPGPKAPVFRSETGAMHDPNSGKDVPCSCP